MSEKPVLTLLFMLDHLECGGTDHRDRNHSKREGDRIISRAVFKNGPFNIPFFPSCFNENELKLNCLARRKKKNLRDFLFVSFFRKSSHCCVGFFFSKRSFNKSIKTEQQILWHENNQNLFLLDKTWRLVRGGTESGYKPIKFVLYS